jgi:hypothetical protein
MMILELNFTIITYYAKPAFITPFEFFFIPLLFHFVWQTMVALNLPKGYSCIITHPLNRHDLPFISLSGIVDADSMLNEGSIPFYIKEDFEGLIKTGTPILQVIPFKREGWKLEEKKGLLEKATVNGIRSLNYSYGWYKKYVWKKKEFN